MSRRAARRHDEDRSDAVAAVVLITVLLLAPFVAPGFAHAAATITVVNADGAGEGFNDPTSVAPVGGNGGATLGAQRLIAFQYAADIWGALVNSSVEIRVRARFNPLSCNASSAVLGSAGPNTVHANFSGRPVSNTWYPAALANKLHGADLCEPGSCSYTTDDIDATFNSTIGTTCALPVSWYLGLDASPPGNGIDLVTVVLHELAHGLGFLTVVNLASGQKLGGWDDTYMLRLEDHSTGALYPAMTDASRVAASTDTGDLHWVGPNVVANSGDLSAGVHPSGHVEMYAPDPQEPGSSVAHFSDALSPDEVMEPSYTGPNHTPGLAVDLMLDIGWWDCGDGLIALSEECDDGNASGGDGCDGCQIEECWTCADEPSVCGHDDGASCDDDKQCTVNDICSGGACSGTPTDGAPCDDGRVCTRDDTCALDACVGSEPLRVGCRSAQKSILLIKDKTPDMNDKLIWKWIKGQSTSQADFADPTATAQYALCLYAGATGSLVAEASVPPDPVKWQPIGAKGYKNLDNRVTAADGIQKVVLKGSSANNAKALLKGKGFNLPTPELPLNLPVTVQLVNSETGVCWEGSYDTGDIKKNEDEQFKAKAETP